MKKQLFSVLSFLVLCIGMQAQTTIANYTFAKSMGSYIALSTPTVLGTATALTGTATALDNMNYRIAFPAGFTFSYDGVAQTDINVNSNGYIGFATAIWTGATTSPLANSPAGGTTSGIISGFARDLNAVYNPTASVVGEISYELIGSAPNRELVVQFKNLKPISSVVDGRLVNFQIHLFESTHTTSANHIEIVYGTCVIDNATATDIKVGIRGNSTTWLSNVNNVMIDNIPVGTTCDWINAVTGNSNTSNMVFTAANTNILIPVGLSFHWAPPVVPVAPVRVFSAVSGITPNDAVIGWTAPLGATQYNVQYRVPGSCSWTNFTGNPVSTNSATLTGLTPVTVYQVRVQSSNGTNNAIWSHIPTSAGGTGTNGYTAAGTFSTGAIPIDLQALQIQSPAINLSGCYSTHSVTVRIKNAGTSTLDFSTNNANINGSVSGPNPITFSTIVLSTGTLAAGATQDVVLSSSYAMNTAGVYTFNADAALAAPDANTSNDAIAPASYTTSAPASLPQLVTFSGYTGTPASLSSNFPGWNEGSVAVTPTIGGDGSFLSSAAAQTTLYSAAAKLNLYSTNTGWIISPKFVPTAAHVFRYKATVLNYNATIAADFGANDTVRAMVSTNCGATWTALRTFNSTTNQGLDNTTNALREYTESLSAYAGQEIMVAIYARRSPTGTVPDIDILIDDLQIFIPPTCYPPTALTTTNTTTTTTDLSFTTPALGTPANYIYEVRTSGAAGSGTLGVVSTGTVVAPSTSVTVTGLTAFTAYTVYVISDCGAGDMSAWSSAHTFTTLADCQVPTALNTSTVLATSANFTWTAGGTETAWDIYYGVQPLSAPTATTAPTATSSVASYSATGLTQMTPYSVYVRSNCGAGSESIWTAVKNFTTPASCPVTSFPLISAITPTSAVATWTAGGTETSWMLMFSAPTTTVLAGPTSSYTMTGLTPSSVYTVQVKGICAVGDSSLWTPVITFTTPCLPPNITSTTPGARCGVGTVTLAATADMGGTLNWYANASGGTALSTGTLFTTPTLTTTTDFYVSTTGAIVSGNGARTAPTATANTTASSYGLVFDAVKSFTLNSVNVFPTGAAGNLVVNLTNNTGVVLQTATVAIPTGTVGTPYTVPLNFTVSPGIGYRLIAVSSPSMIRESSLGGFPYSLGQVGNITSGYIGGTSATYYFFYNWQFSYGCESARSMVTATVNSAPALTLNSPAAICAGSETGAFSVTSTLSDYDTYVWSPTANIYSDAAATIAYSGSSATDVYVKSNAAGVLTINANATNSVTGCAAVASTTIMIKNAPTSITVSATPTVICAGNTTSLSAMANPIPVVLLNEGFNGPTNSWIATNNSTGGTPANAAWTLRNSPYTSNVGTGMTSNDASQFYLTDSDSQGSGGTTGTVLQSPSINTMGMNSLNLSFFHYYNYYTSDVSTKVEVSTDGTNWTSVQDYKTGAVDIGTPAAFAPANINLNSYINFPTLYVRFNYNTAWGYGWAIDNVLINGLSTNAYDYSWTSSPAGFTATTSTATAMPTGTTDYSVVITNTNTSCSNSGVVTVSVNPVPTIVAMSSSTAVCAGSSATLTATGATNYTWTSGGNTATEVVTPSSLSVYTVTGTDNGCSNTATVSVDVNSLPTVSATASSTLVCAGIESSTLTASTSATSYTWSNGANTMTTSVTPTTGTTYTVMVNDGNCDAMATVFVDAQICMGINGVASVSEINIYPNPTNGILNVSLSSELSGTTSIEVYDGLGKLAIKENLSNDSNSINLSKLEDGIYIFKIINNNKTVKVGKVVKQ